VTLLLVGCTLWLSVPGRRLATSLKVDVESTG